MKEKLQWSTAKRRVSDLVPYEKNPRKLDEKQAADLSRSLKKFSLVEIPAINLDGKILAGHQRVKIMKLLGRGEEIIDVRIPNRKLTEAEYNEYLLRSNANTGSWNYDLLQNYNMDLLLDIGFDDTQLSQIWDGLEIEDDQFDVEKEIKRAKKTNIKTGDLFQLGNHFLICGDSHEQKTLDRLLGNKKVGMIYNDPIYNIGIDYDNGIGGKANYGGKVNDHKTGSEYKDFLKQGLENSLRHAEKNCHVFTWNDQNNIWLVQTLYKELGIKNQRVCFWVKNGFNPTPKIAFNKATESCIYGTVGKPFLSPYSKKLCEVLNKEIGTGNRALDDILDIFDIWLAKRDAGSNYNHSTQKPLTLHEKPLKRCTKPGDIVLDIYGGSGSTLLSCDQLRRICYTSEQSNIFCQLIINRYETATNVKAKKIA
ncbi:MAG: DNA methyltransferase [Patescibacteria group bacterium]|jgi:DNA modification methylase